MKIGIKNHSMEFRISKKSIYKIKKAFSEKPSKFFVTKKTISIEENSKNILVIEFNAIRYQTFFEQMANTNLNFTIYNRRNPAFWNAQSYNLIKQSDCIIETKNSLYDTNLKKNNFGWKNSNKNRNFRFIFTRKFFQILFLF